MALSLTLWISFSLCLWQQLNFYAFRKIKYADSLRIDPQLEKETANYWRFRHEHFRRGRADLLSDIKRMNAAQPKHGTSASPNAVTSSATVVEASEVQALKARIEEMNKNIDHLTAMVEKVNLKQEVHEQEQCQVPMEEDYFVGNKRKKVLASDDTTMPAPVVSFVVPEPALSTVMMTMPEPSTSMAMDDLEALPAPDTLPLPDPAPFSGREMSTDTTQTDLDFVDQLLHLDSDEDEDDDDEVQFLAPFEEPVVHHNNNRPDPELMQRLSDALALLPKNMQEMIVDRLIQSITSPDFEKNFVPTPQPEAVPVEVDRQAAVPLAAATLAALLQHLCAQASSASNKDAPTHKIISKILPVVPVHA